MEELGHVLTVQLTVILEISLVKQHVHVNLAIRQEEEEKLWPVQVQY